MSWLFSQALVAEYSEANSSDGEPSPPSSGTPTPLAYCAPDRMTAFSRLSRFGMTFAPLTEDRGEELLKLCRADFRAKTSAPLGKAQALMASDPACGVTWHESSVKYDLHSHGWKTHRTLWVEDLPESSVTLPTWGMCRDGVVLARTTPSGVLAIRARITSAHASGFLQRFPTPRSNDAEKRGNFDITNPRNGLPAAVKRFPTPTASDHKGSGPTMVRSDGKKRGDRLDYATERNPDGSPTGGQLNPTWVEWLMGWPLGWTDLKPLATDKFPSALPKPGESSPPMSEAA